MAEPPSERPPEFDFIDWVRRQTVLRPEIQLGIGDDAAVIASPRPWITTVDVVTEGVHFTSETAPRLIGRKAMTVNVSDLAAMAADPVAALVGIVFPRSRGRHFAEEFYAGLFEAADEFDLSVAGGDTNTWNGPLVVSITAFGLATGRGPVLRSGARPGDWILVTGPLGGSLRSGRHLTFAPRVREAIALHQQADIHAMLDLSDGLASDLFHILDSSGVGARIDASAIPIHDDVDPALPFSQRLTSALHDGEDFELLLTVSPEVGRRLLSSPPEGVRLDHIGEIVRSPGARLVLEGRDQPLARGGWSHPFGADDQG